MARGLNCRDAKTGVNWPLPVINLSPRDAALPGLDELA
jgi:dTDP-4-dehydrorhamnose 3,5-epimerase-like enzyme